MQLNRKLSWRDRAATKPERILQEAAEGTEKPICPLITRIGADEMPCNPRPSAQSAENSDTAYSWDRYLSHLRNLR
jgi:hypothetical protein